MCPSEPTRTPVAAYDLGFEDGREGRFVRMGQVGVDGRKEYEHGWLIGQAERIAAGLPAARTAEEDESAAAVAEVNAHPEASR